MCMLICSLLDMTSSTRGQMEEYRGCGVGRWLLGNPKGARNIVVIFSRGLSVRQRITIIKCSPVEPELNRGEVRIV